MPNPNANEIIQMKHKRNFVQWGGPGPQNDTLYAGQNAQYIAIEGVTRPGVGSVDPIWVHDPNKIGRFKLIGRSLSAPDLPSATVMMREFHGDVPRQMIDIDCVINFYEVSGDCKDPSNFLKGWADYVLVYSMAVVTDMDMGSRSSWDSDDPIEDTLNITLSDIFAVAAVGFGEKGGTQADREVADVVYGGNVQCGNCGIKNDGTQMVYAVTKSSGSGSPGLPSELIYTLDGGASVQQANIDGIGATEDAIGIDIANDILIVITGDAYYYATININTGAPGAFTKTAVASSYGDPTDIFVVSPTEIYITCTGGAILKITNITAGFTQIEAPGNLTANDLLRVHGTAEIRVVVGASGTIGVSTNRGQTWSIAVATPTAQSIQAVAVVTNLKWFIGTADGRVYYTLDGAESWTEIVFSGAGTGAVEDIINYGEEIIWFSHTTATPAARLFSSWDGGRNFTYESPRIKGLPVFDQASRLALPNDAENTTIAANHLAVGGIAADGTDGIFLLGVVSKL